MAALPPSAHCRQAQAVSKTRPAGSITASRVTSSGLVYLQSEKAAAAASKAASAALGGKTSVASHRGTLPTTPVRTKPPTNGTRKLLAINGNDDRWEVTSWNGAHSWPYRAVGHIRSGCSGALIGPATVLTAGHVSPCPCAAGRALARSAQLPHHCCRPKRPGLAAQRSHQLLQRLNRSILVAPTDPRL